MRSTATTLLADRATVAVAPWPDPLIEQEGFDPRSAYVERFWLGILGPSTTLLLRRLVDALDDQPEGYTLDLTETAQALGVGIRGGRTSPFLRAVDRSCRFGATKLVGRQTLAVRRKLAPLNQRQVDRLPQTLRTEHESWQQRSPRRPEVADLRDRARRLALSLLEVGEDPPSTERQLHRWRFHPAIAHDAMRWAVEQHTRAALTASTGATDQSDTSTEIVLDLRGPAARATTMTSTTDSNRPQDPQRLDPAG